MVLWVDKYRPHSLAKLDLHADITERLQHLVQNADFPHLLFYGPSGAGKKTRVAALLRELFGSGVEKIRVSQKSVKLRSKVIELSTLQSNYHIEMTPAEAGNNDRQIIQEVIKELAQTANIISIAGESQSSKSSHSDRLDRPSYKVVILNEVDRLSMGAQQALRRTMEKYTSTCRLILVCESLTRVIDPLRSRCLPIRVPAPTNEVIHSTLRAIAKRENIGLSDKLADRIVEQSDRNLRKAILLLESCAVKHPTMTVSSTDISPVRADWENFIDFVGKLIVEEQSPERLLIVRSKLYELLTNCIPPEIVLRALVAALMRRVDDELKAELCHWAAHYDHRMALGTKPVFHLEAFVARFMAGYKRYTIEAFG